MLHIGMILMGILSFLPQSLGLNVLMISIGAAGHVTPMFELAKAMKNHNVTFLTEQAAKSYIDFASHPRLSSFRLIYTTDSVDEFMIEKKKEQEILSFFANHSVIDNFAYLLPVLGEGIYSLLNKTVKILMSEQVDVIITNSVMPGVNVLCQEAKISCVVQSTEVTLNIFDLNLPISHSFLSSKQVTQLKSRLSNVALTLSVTISMAKKLIPVFYRMLQSFPRVPGPFYESFTFKKILFTNSKCLNLISVPSTLYPSSHSDHYNKYLGAFVDESSTENIDNDLLGWIQSKPTNSIVYVAFGTTVIVQLDRMQTMINGLVAFLLQAHDVSALISFRGVNSDTYQILLNEMNNDEYRRVLMDDQRVKIINRFVQQKWILHQKSVSLFLSHCGMGSSVEGIYFQKPILCIPFHSDQFANAIAIEHSGVGQSLFIPPSPLELFVNPYGFHVYTFTVNNVTTKLSILWRNSSYENAVRIMSLEMKHAGGVKRAVEEIEFFVHLNGDLDRYAPFKSTLPFYQQYLVDILILYIVLPFSIVIYLFVKCCKRSRKEKND